jgi:hypothetical protein
VFVEIGGGGGGVRGQSGELGDVEELVVSGVVRGEGGEEVIVAAAVLDQQPRFGYDELFLGRGLI